MQKTSANHLPPQGPQSGAPGEARSHPYLMRQGGLLTRAIFYLAVPWALLSALWVVAGRSLFGADGSLLPIFAISLGPILAGLMLAAAYFSGKEMKLQKAGKRAGLPPRTALVWGATWLMALIFGFLVPDRLDGTVVSAASSLLGGDFIGLSAGFGNPAGILTYAFATASLLLSLSNWRRAESVSRGVDDSVKEELERAESIYDFLD
ncbi:hypothetical protein ACN082_01775 [Rothia sp. CCM 9417]|uniref:hypothetical protein n=1 Tax=Rothia sp. CCM 9417 TaxID=3402657 RepID=UPI003AE501B8